jgi:7-keto-8-aminopelargonate synthetase-like enzyme
MFVALTSEDDVIIVDMRAHSSIMQGIKSVRCKVYPFRHNDVDHLEKILSRSAACARRFVVTDSVFSTDGDLAPIDAIVKLCARYDAIPIVDDSHGFGVLGKTGRGVFEHFGIKKFGGIYTASLAKAFANNGGVLAGSFETLEYLRHCCPHLAYSTAVPPAILGGILGALDAIEKDFEQLSEKMWNYRQRIRSSVTEAGMTLLEGASPINAVFTGNVRNTLLLSKALYEKGVLSMAFIEPSVPQGECLVRLVASAGLEANKIERACEIIGECGCGISWS